MMRETSDGISNWIDATQIASRLGEMGVNPTAFWAWAMGGDRRDSMGAQELEELIGRFLTETAEE